MSFSDVAHQRNKRKREYEDDDYSNSYPSVRMPTEDWNPNSPPATSSSNSFIGESSSQHSHFRASTSTSTQPAPNRIQFFVRMISESKTLVLNGKPDDRIKHIHEKIQAATGIPVDEQRLIYCGRQLMWDHTLAECMIRNDAGLHLVGRMRSTEHPKAWHLVNDFVSTIYKLCKGELGVSLNSVELQLMEFFDMMRDDGIKDLTEDLAVPHMKIFHSLCAPSALVMLYMSPHLGNRECAEDSIMRFLDSTKTTLPECVYSQCAPVMLDFCKLIGRVASHDDPLYNLSRSSLGSAIKYLKVGRNSWKYDAISNKTVYIAVEDIFPYLSELGSKVSEDLSSSLESKSDISPLPSDVCDFAAFLRPIKGALKGLPDYGGLIPTPVRNRFSFYGDEIKKLFSLFFDLFKKIFTCIHKMEGELVKDPKGDGGWDQYLVILKAVCGMAKVYQGQEEMFWDHMKRYKVSLRYLILKYAKRGEYHKWVLGHKELLDFESRRHLVMMMLPEMKNVHEELYEMLIDRSKLLDESFEYITSAKPEQLRVGLFMEFKNEEATGPGVLREWFFLVCREIFNPRNALFVACPNDRRRFFPNAASKVNPLHLEYFKFAGRVIALALMHKVQVGIVFDRVFFLQLGGIKISLDDIKDADPCLHKSCKQILEMDPAALDQDVLGLTFVHEFEELGSKKVVELFVDGENVVVNSRNREEYVDLLIQHRFVTCVEEQVENFAKGFAEIVGKEKIQKWFFKGLEVEDLDAMLHGSESVISVEDWKKHTEYNGYDENDCQIMWFWEIVGEMTPKQRKILLSFWTSIKHLPVEGFGGLTSKLYVYKSNDSVDFLPSSHTCFYRICIPAYPSLCVMRERINIITQEHVGCSFGTG